jgi:hypothetical protein
MNVGFTSALLCNSLFGVYPSMFHVDVSFSAQPSYDFKCAIDANQSNGGRLKVIDVLNNRITSERVIFGANDYTVILEALNREISALQIIQQQRPEDIQTPYVGKFCYPFISTRLSSL